MLLLGSFLNIFMSSPPGQLSVLHEVEEVDDPEHSFPPSYGPFFFLERVVVPPPHVLEHDPQELQVFQVQSTKIVNSL